jgi:hypothetical protein
MISPLGKLIRSCAKPVKTRDHYARLLKSNFIECISSVLFRREAIIKASGFNPALQASEDYDLCLRITREHPVCCHSTFIAEYRLHGTNASHRSELMLTSTLHVLHSQAPYAFQSFKRSVCYACGLWLWRRKYGRQLTRELANVWPGGAGRRLEQWRFLARMYPQGSGGACDPCVAC